MNNDYFAATVYVLTKKYNFILPKEDREIEDQNNFTSPLFELPEGWVISFIDQMLFELRALLLKYNSIDKYELEQCKEKFGSLRWYDNLCSCIPEEEAVRFHMRWEQISEYRCALCGKFTTYQTTGWIVPICKKHIMEEELYEHPYQPIAKVTQFGTEGNTTYEENVDEMMRALGME